MVTVCRVTNRLFVGLPLCRDPDYIALNVQFAIDLVTTGTIINTFPAFLRPLVAKLCTKVPASIQREMKRLKPIIDERRRNPDDQPDDLLSWLMKTREEQSVRDLTIRVLMLNFTAIHTSSMTFTFALHHLAAQPEYAEKLREEIELVVEEEGWTKDALDKMHLLDSFVKESQRLNPLNCLGLQRKALEDFTLSCGTVVPAGTTLSAALAPTHLDEEVYSNACYFDGFRFVGVETPEGVSAHQPMVATTDEYLSFGYGNYACPGRFFAAMELKMMLAHVVTTYDVKLKDGKRPGKQWFGTICVPDRKAEVMFRKR